MMMDVYYDMMMYVYHHHHHHRWTIGKEVAKFGTELWERLNGKEEGVPSLGELFGQVQESVPQSEEIDR